MLTVQQAFEYIMQTSSTASRETVDISDADGRVLMETIIADRPFPPFDRITMDGIAINYNDYGNGQRSFAIQGMQAAGDPQKTLADGCCIEVMTGTVLPANADTVIPYEHLQQVNNTFLVTNEVVKQQNIHRKASDVGEGEVLLDNGVCIGGAEIAVLASVGKQQVTVSKKLKVALVATGNELVPVNQRPEAHQVRMSNVYALKAVLNNHNTTCTILHLNDDKKELLQSFSSLFNEYDLIICSGGVSAGKLDYIPEVLAELAVDIKFHKVKQRPGKPLLFAVSKNNVLFFGLPGNPVSGFMCLHRYVIPWIHKTIGIKTPVEPLKAVLKEDILFDKPLTFFPPVHITTSNNGTLIADPHLTNGSGDYATLTSANAFLELPDGKDIFKKGEVYDAWFYR
ncbi:molybdopterin molybdotransferase MoeA [Danxiaibacter flavus]|uniref:Molybdopterin molybdenumtransferase n=1 Tax=Danxiaibacter flavus TaxID=3049108 RepID=A0ABV3ZIK3_9BACT|nr:molybdopterin molybdotransferase MoeA [Chitinophagaceae bacterium DXS]